MRIRWSRNGRFWRAETKEDLAAEITDTRKPYPLRRGRIPGLGRAGQAASTEGEVALRPPHLVAALLEHREAPDPEPGIERRQLGEGAVEHLLADVVGHRDVRVVREGQLTVERPATNLVLHPFVVTDPEDQRHKHDRRDRPEGGRDAQVHVERR